jgi:prepilin-type N-terminal cleavage/methylation domain-containing protein
MKPRIMGGWMRSGFTLVEVVATLVVLSILAVVITAGMHTPASVVAEAGILRAHLGFAQSLAMANNTATWSVQFSGNAYTLLRDGQPAPIRWPGEPSATHVLGRGVGSTAGTVSLDRWGAPAATFTATLTDGRYTESVTITGFTGLIP